MSKIRILNKEDTYIALVSGNCSIVSGRVIWNDPEYNGVLNAIKHACYQGKILKVDKDGIYKELM